MIDLKNCRYPVSLEPFEAMKLVSLLHELKVHIASLNVDQGGLYDKVATVLRILDGLKTDPREGTR